MHESARKWLRITLAVPAGLLSLAPLIFGLYLLKSWIWIHTRDVYYVDYPYLLVGMLFAAIGCGALFCTKVGVARRSYFGLAFAVPIFLGLYTMVYIPSGMPHLQMSLMTDTNYLSHIQTYLRQWYESHKSFPKDESEFREALRAGAAAWQEPTPPNLSEYAKSGTRLPYEIVVALNASGPRIENLTTRPGVIYYNVSADRQQFWVTMTSLEEDVSPSGGLKRVANISDGKPWLVTAQGKDYPFKD